MSLTEIDIVKSHVVQGALKSRNDMVSCVVCVPEFCCNEEFLSLDEAFIHCSLQPLTDLFLVTIISSSIEESVSRLDGLGL